MPPPLHHLPYFLPKVAALCAAPFLMDRPDIDTIFPDDAMARAKKILAAVKGGVGAYTDSRGDPLVREEVANFFTDRDGVASNADVSRLSTWLHIYCCDCLPPSPLLFLRLTLPSPPAAHLPDKRCQCGRTHVSYWHS